LLELILLEQIYRHDIADMPNLNTGLSALFAFHSKVMRLHVEDLLKEPQTLMVHSLLLQFRGLILHHLDVEKSILLLPLVEHLRR